MAAATTCGACDGRGRHEDGTPCLPCGGTGAVLADPPAGCIICDAPVPEGTDLCHHHKWFDKATRSHP